MCACVPGKGSLPDTWVSLLEMHSRRLCLIAVLFTPPSHVKGADLCVTPFLRSLSTGKLQQLFVRRWAECHLHEHRLVIYHWKTLDQTWHLLLRTCRYDIFADMPIRRYWWLPICRYCRYFHMIGFHITVLYIFLKKSHYGGGSLY